MKKTNEIPEDGLGLRFLLFRKAIKRTRAQLAGELGIPLSDVESIENSGGIPDIDILYYLNRQYRLNINWMLCMVGDMFLDSQPPDDRDVDTNFTMTPPPDKNHPRYGDYIEFMRLMQIPQVEKAVLSKLKEVKEGLKKDR